MTFARRFTKTVEEPMVQQHRIDGVVRFYNFLSEDVSFLGEVLAGLSKPQKTLPPDYFYDARGRALFEQLCEQPEYYCARAELAIMREHAAAMATLLGPDCQLIEFGGGSGEKSRILIERLRPLLYVPLERTFESMRADATGLAQAFPWLNISGVCADYTKSWTMPEFVGVPIRKKAVYLPALAIGQVTPPQALGLLQLVRRMVGAGGTLLAGVEMKTDKQVLEAAYNDVAGATAAFNLNLLARINRELGADFQLRRFRHRAHYDESRDLIEMNLESLATQLVHIDGERIAFRQGETVLTGIACSYSVEQFRDLAQQAGFAPAEAWADPAGLFSVQGMVAV
ncbi:MAG: L-histidine N(alpha)-methyltransferase [Burkholderiales bacterium]|nr:L-histidine N(alpha)-methyltransferase [Burkholderiales bacterium]